MLADEVELLGGKDRSDEQPRRVDEGQL